MFYKNTAALINYARSVKVSFNLLESAVKINNKIRSSYKDLSQREKKEQNVNYNFEKLIARVVELVDTRDLKSLEGNFVPVQVGPGYHKYMKQEENNPKSEINLIEIIKILKLNRFLILLLLSFCSFCAIVYSLYLPNLYISESSVELQSLPSMKSESSGGSINSLLMNISS